MQIAGENELESLLAEGNHLLEELMLANGLQLIEGEPVDLGNIDEIAVPVSLVSPHTDDMFNSDPVFMDYPLSDLSNGCSSPVSSFSLPTLGEQSELSDLLESLLEESGDSSSYIDDDVSSPSSPASSFYSISEEDNSPKPEKKRRATPYSKLPAGRKERKKQQNKEAAIRYREKKRSEAQEITGEEDRLSSVNKTLKSDVLNLEREIACMKELLSDVFDIHSLWID